MMPMMRVLVVASLLMMMLGANGGSCGDNDEVEWRCSAVCKDAQDADILTFEPRSFYAEYEEDAVNLCATASRTDSSWCPVNAPTPTDRCNCQEKS